jgi:hypothetical protein
MPVKIVKYSVFVASPSDVKEERLAVDDVIKELNRTYSESKGIIIEVLKWETHAAPGIINGSVQGIINNDIGDCYDLFIGVMWKRFGTPTDVAMSGTEEEFQRAYDRFKEKKNLQVLFYFNNSTPSSLSDVNPAELGKVLDFKNRIGNKNVLYWEYNKIEEFQAYLRMHIPQRLNDLIEQNRGSENSEQITLLDNKNLSQNDLAELEEDDDLGVLDFQDSAEEFLANSTNSLERMADATTWVGREITKKTEELNNKKRNSENIGKHYLRDFCIRVARIYDDYANRLDVEIPIFSTGFDKGVASFSKAISLSRTDLLPLSSTEETIIINAVSGMQTVVLDSIEKMGGLLESVRVMPRMSKELNKSRNNLVSKLENLKNQLETSFNISVELQKMFMNKGDIDLIQPIEVETNSI